MNQEKYISDLKEIKEIMNRSSRFISLSGLSGVFAGIIALIGAYVAYQVVFRHNDYLESQNVIISGDDLTNLFIIGICTLIFSIIVVIYFTTRETKKRNQKIWDHQTKRLLINLGIPLFTGGILILMFIFQGLIGFVVPFTLIFYGLALVNASKYTLDEVRSLGIIEIILGLAGVYFIGYGLILWSLGFGILHIIYGLVMQSKYKS